MKTLRLDRQSYRFASIRRSPKPTAHEPVVDLVRHQQDHDENRPEYGHSNPAVYSGREARHGEKDGGTRFDNLEGHPTWLKAPVAPERPNQEPFVKVDEVLSHQLYFGERQQSAARDQCIIHTTRFYRESAALRGSMRGERKGYACDVAGIYQGRG